MEKFDQKQLVYLLAEAWNTLSIDRIEPYLSEDIEYDSHWVFETLTGKSAFLAYLNGKFNTLKIHQRDSVMHIVAEIAHNRSLPNLSPVIVLTQYSAGELNEAGLFVTCKEGLISRISLSLMPDAELVMLTDVRPGK